MHPLAAGAELILPFKLGEEIRFVVLGRYTANVKVPLLFEITALVKMYDERPCSSSHAFVPSVANNSLVIIVGDRRLSDRYLEIRQIVSNLHQLLSSAGECNDFRMV